tara:strand:- start:1627 stop:3774 length:2148 start_codon:yes stop_codon:yes gene_type:complete
MMNEVDQYEDLTQDDIEGLAEEARLQAWLEESRSAYAGSTDYLESSLRRQWEINLHNFQGRHRDESERKKKIFRPKIRTSLRSHEASLAAALFTNNDVLDVKGANPNDKVQDISAKLNKELVQHRLDVTIPWFQTVMGAYQDANVYGVCASKTYWEYEVKRTTAIEPYLDEYGEPIFDEDGEIMGEEVITDEEVLKDEPVIDLLAPENLLHDPNADWRNPVHDSPYIIEIMPMFAGDVIERMGKQDDKTLAPSWYEYSIEQVMAHGQADDNESLRQVRAGHRADPNDVNVKKEHKTVYVHFNIIKKDGVDMAFYTLGTGLMLSEPVPLTDYYQLGRDTYTVGTSIIETHRTVPGALAELGENLQREANVIANQRLENVRLVLNKRYFIRNQSNVDLAALMRNVPGGGVMVENPNEDVKIVNTPDVTGSSYAEQDRLNMDIDEVMGSFSQSTIAANRTLNETVGGMNLMSAATNDVQEYMMRTFIETWVEPVMRAISKLEQMYETDTAVLSVAGDKAGIRDQLIQIAGSQEYLDKLIQQDLLVKVNVGMGNTNPEQKLKRLMMAINTVSGMPEAAGKTDWEEVTKEVYSFAGYGDGGRFLKKDDPEAQPQMPVELQMEQAKQKFEMEKLQLTLSHESQMQQMKIQTDSEVSLVESNNRRELELIKLAESKDLKLEDLRTKLQIESSKDKTKRDIEALKANTSNREMNIKTTMGSGI